MGVEKLFSNGKSIVLLNSNDRRIGIVLLKAGEDVGFHGEGVFEEKLYVLRGRGKAVIGNSEKDFGEGEIVHINSCKHNVINCGNDILIYVYDCIVKH
jgi:mannose-6-phosphate isomerase-like protein (cupin superfamily)